MGFMFDHFQKIQTAKGGTWAVNELALKSMSGIQKCWILAHLLADDPMAR